MIFNDLIFCNGQTVCVCSSILNKITISDNKVSEEIDALIPTHLGTAYLKMFVCVCNKKKKQSNH